MPLTEMAEKQISSALRVQHGSVVKRIEDLLNGQNVTLNDIPVTGFDPDETPLERLKRFMRHLDATRKLLGTKEFGRCAKCGVELDERMLLAMPWADRCRACPG